MTQDIAEPQTSSRAEDSEIEGIEPIDIEETGAEEEESLGQSFARLYADGRAYAQAEAERQKLRAGILAGGVRDAAILGVVAITLLFAAIVALLVGFVLALAPIVGALGATGIVFGSTLLIVILLLMLAKSRIGRMKRDLRP